MEESIDDVGTAIAEIREVGLEIRDPRCKFLLLRGPHIHHDVLEIAEEVRGGDERFEEIDEFVFKVIFADTGGLTVFSVTAIVWILFPEFSLRPACS